jgi:folate-binding protein YgfZ
VSDAKTQIRVGRRARAYVRVSGPQAADYLHRMLSNDVLALEAGGSCEALLLTPKARVIAPLVVVRRGGDDFLLLTEAELGEVVRDHLVQMRFAARAEIELEEHEAHLLVGATEAEGALTVANDEFGVPAVEVLDRSAPDGLPEVAPEELERLRIEAGTPRFGKDIDDRVLPAEAGLVERAVSFTKGCYPGQEPIARLQHRGHVNRRLRVLEIEGDEVPQPGAEILHEGKAVGRVTSAVAADGRVVALGYVRVEVPKTARLSVAGAAATMTPPARP